jgi:hypothetical protein
MTVAVHALVFLAGGALLVWTLLSAVRAVVLPRGDVVLLSRIVFVGWRDLFRLIVRPLKTYEQRDSVFALYAPVALLTLPMAWLILVLAGYTGMDWALGGRSVRQAFELSGSAVTSLGSARAGALPQTVLAYSEAVFGFGLLALLIAYLPSMYAAFSRREASVALLEVRAGSPPSVAQMMRRFQLIHGLDRLTPTWVEWERWFAEVEESHTSLPALVFFRSPRPERSWVTAAGAVLDTASFAASTLDRPRDAQAELCVRAGYLALRRVADFFRIPYPADPAPTDPITIRREEYDALYDELAEIGVPLKADRDQAWRDFAGWRVNYDVALVALATLVMAPYAPWSSDRRVDYLTPSFFNVVRRRRWPADRAPGRPGPTAR